MGGREEEHKNISEPWGVSNKFYGDITKICRHQQSIKGGCRLAANEQGRKRGEWGLHKKTTEP